MTTEQFIEKMGVANKTIGNLNLLVNKIQQDKLDTVQVYTNLNKKFNFNQRVKCNEHKNNEEHFLGYGYIKNIFVDEDYGVVFYEILKENTIDKTQSNDYFDISQFGVINKDNKYCNLIIYGL